jgi:hypothetical protein
VVPDRVTAGTVVALGDVPDGATDADDLLEVADRRNTRPSAVAASAPSATT